MNYLVDIGNASIKVAKTEFLNNKYFLKDISYFNTKETLKNFENSIFFVKIIKPNKFNFMIISSVVKELSAKISHLNYQKIIFFKTLLTLTKTKILLNKNLDLNLIGDDILAMTYYFKETDIFSNKLIFSLGTANVAIFMKNNVLEGCLFALGLEPQAIELLNYCSEINEKKTFQFDRFSFLVKQDTKTAIEAGSLYQTAGFCELVTSSYQYQAPICYLTGGNAKYVKFLLSKKYLKIGNLVLKGLLNFLNQNLNFFDKFC